MTNTTLRDLAQAVVDAWPAFRDAPTNFKAYHAWNDACSALNLSGHERSLRQAEAILAALDAADAQGYARAMGEVVALDERDPCPICNVADWARERLPAAAERD